ncbi:hypothetical protein EIP86_001341 [Pleurotus ostreatoroseus]|nr:hypothetical protein EIP86_001341 [Pleurotus ostreatoroseus]
MLTELQAAQGTITTASLETLLQELLAESAPDVPTSVTCSDCSKEMFIVMEQGFPGLLGASASSDLSQTCGANFTDGSAPSDVRQTANDSTSSADSTSSSSTSGDLPVFDVSAAGVTLSTLLTALFAFLG